MHKLLFFDLETTGLDPVRNGIHQLAGYVVIDGEIKQTFDIKMQPRTGCAIEEEALKVAGKTLNDLQGYQPMRFGYLEFTEMLSKYISRFNKADKFFLVGFNNRSFDEPFLRQWFIDNGDKYFGAFFWPNSIDVLVLATPYLMNHRHVMPNFQLKTVASTLGIKIDETKLHDALYDIELTREIYKIIPQHIKLPTNG